MTDVKSPQGQSAPPQDGTDATSRQANRLVSSNLFRAECHGTAARHFSNVHIFVGALAAGLAAASGGSAFTGNTTLAGTLGLVSAAFAGLLTALRPDERSQLHWKAAGEYFRQADEVYMAFWVAPGTENDNGAPADLPVTAERNAPPEPKPVESETKNAQSVVDPVRQLRSFQDDFHRLETVGPPVPRRLERKTKQWIRDDQEWFPPQYDKFADWWQEKLERRDGRPVRRLFGGSRRPGEPSRGVR